MHQSSRSFCSFWPLWPDYVSAACYIYDCCLTLPRVAGYLWGRKPSIILLIFLANRYFMLWSIMFLTVQLVVWSGSNLARADHVGSFLFTDCWRRVEHRFSDVKRNLCVPHIYTNSTNELFFSCNIAMIFSRSLSALTFIVITRESRYQEHQRIWRVSQSLHLSEHMQYGTTARSYSCVCWALGWFIYRDTRWVAHHSLACGNLSIVQIVPHGNIKNPSISTPYSRL